MLFFFITKNDRLYTCSQELSLMFLEQPPLPGESHELRAKQGEYISASTNVGNTLLDFGGSLFYGWFGS